MLQRKPGGSKCIQNLITVAAAVSTFHLHLLPRHVGQTIYMYVYYMIF